MFFDISWLRPVKIPIVIFLLKYNINLPPLARTLSYQYELLMTITLYAQLSTKIMSTGS